MSIAGIKNHFIYWRDWELNPIVIKELRQGVRSWTVTGMLLLFLTIMFIAAIGFLVTQSFDTNENMQLGGSMFSVFLAILGGASILFIPLYTGVRVSSERQENNLDLLYVSTLSPNRIILGKLLCSAYVALLFFSACMPFMAFTNLLRGVDLRTVFFSLVYLFMVVCTANMAAIFFACLPISRQFKILLVLFAFFTGFGMLSGLFRMLFSSRMFGSMGFGFSGNFWEAAGMTVLLTLMFIGLFFVLSVALISPPSANRALPVRLYVTGIWLLGGILCFCCVLRTGNVIYMEAWINPTFMVMMISLLVVISNADQFSRRMRRTIPARGLKKLWAFLFFNGAAGGLLWVAGILLATFLATNEIVNLFPSSTTALDSSGSWFSVTTIYAFDYALLALLLHRKLFPKRPPKLAGLLALILAGVWAIAPGVILFFMNKLSWKELDGLQLGNLFNVSSRLDYSQMQYHLVFACAWLLIMLWLNARWFLEQVKNFRPLPAEAPPVLE